MKDRATFDLYCRDPAAYRSALLIDVDGVVRRFNDVMEPWQRADFAAQDPGWLRCAGRSSEPAKMRAYLERGRGHSKTTDIAAMASWALAFSSHPLRGYGFAADRDQSRLLLDAMQRQIRLNPWLGNILEVQQHKIVNIGRGLPGEGSVLEIAASDVGSSYGILPDFIVGDELCHWPDNAEELWSSIISSAAKKANCVLCLITNSGFVDSWQWKVREAVRTDPDWVFSRLDGPQASWLTEARLAEQRRLLPTIAYARLWLNQWSSGGGDALTRDDVEAAFKSDLRPLPPRLAGYEFVAGVDLGVSRDCSVVVVLGVRRANRMEEGRASHGRIRLAKTRIWRPTPGNKVDLQQIEDELRTLHEGYRLKQINVDPWNATHLCQRLALSKLPINEVPPVGKQLQGQATALIEAFNDRRVDLFEDPDLRRDLLRLRVEEKQYGFRLTSPRDEHGHGDMASAFCLALLAATEIAGKLRIKVGANAFQSSPSEFSSALAARGMWSRMIQGNDRERF